MEGGKTARCHSSKILKKKPAEAFLRNVLGNPAGEGGGGGGGGRD